MGTRVIARNTLLKYGRQFPDARAELLAWHSVVSKATIDSFAAAQAADPRVSLVNREYLVFDIRGGTYRLITRVYFPAATIFIKDFLRHADYDRWSDAQRKKKSKKNKGR